MKTGAVLQVVRDREGGAFCFAHVLRRRPAGASSPFTSLRRTPHPPDRVTLLQFCGRNVKADPAKGGGGPAQRGKGGEPGAAWLGGHEQRRSPTTLGAHSPMEPPK